MPKVIEILLEIALIAVIMGALVVICTNLMSTGGTVDTGFTNVVDTIFNNIKTQVGVPSTP